MMHFEIVTFRFDKRMIRKISEGDVDKLPYLNLNLVVDVSLPGSTSAFDVHIVPIFVQS